jgi:hypothetical protein
MCYFDTDPPEHENKMINGIKTQGKLLLAFRVENFSQARCIDIVTFPSLFLS